jgi:hypothetical protein
VLGLQRPLQNHQNFEKFPEINTHFPKIASVITQVFLSGRGFHRLKKGRKITSLDPERSSGSEIFADRMAFILAGSRMSGRFHTLIKTVTQKQLQEECISRGLAKSGNKPELLARLQAYEAQQAGGERVVKREEFAIIDITLGTPIPDTPTSSSHRAFDFPEYYPTSEEEDLPNSK